MLQLTYRYTDHEYARVRRLNKMLGVSRWVSYAIVFACLIPSFVLSIIAFSYLAIIAVSLIAFFLLVFFIFMTIKAPRLTDKHDHLLTLTPDSIHEKNSHSEFEMKWEYFEELIENPEDLMLRRLERFMVLPKRIFDSQQLEQFRVYARKVGHDIQEDDPPLESYRKMLTNDSVGSTLTLADTIAGQGPRRIYKFQYQREDLQRIPHDPLKLIDVSQSGAATKKAGSWQVTLWFAILIFIGMFLIQSPGGAGTVSFLQYCLLGAAMLLPFALLLVAARILRTLTVKQTPDVPPDQNRLALLKSGFAIGTPLNVTYYDWRDVDDFYENQTVYGFKTFNELIQVIPKRMFGDPGDAEMFLNQSMAYRREFQRNFVPVATAVETGNPYQPPAN